ncbi:hypothetical protein TL16_g07443 [Triparma laevis f. inornata]|uniref:Guanylate cyclase domain-containing protein n=1 Tax=Triparma laevis f. inornata TaxID=1714386 RepID=A0A9W7AVV7_9STRA|nr:hypothetical protein TL16_g07443 [Triparma laevis f. inornata]
MVDYTNKELLSFCPIYLQDTLVQQRGTELKHGNAWKEECVVGIVDISGFSSLANEWSSFSSLLAETINLIFSTLITSIDSTSGDIINFAGDALICTWKCEEGEEGLERTVRKAVKAIKEIHENIEKSESESILSVHTGVGLESGNLMWVGEGGAGVFQFFVTGKALENASVGLSLAKPGEIVFCPVFSTVFESKGSGDTSSRLSEVPDSGGFCVLKSTKTTSSTPNPSKKKESANDKILKRQSSEAVVMYHSDNVNQIKPSKHQLHAVHHIDNQEDWDELIEKIAYFIPSPALDQIQNTSNSQSNNHDIRAMNVKRRVTTVFVNFELKNAVPTNETEANDQGLRLQTLFTRVTEILQKDEFDGMVRQFLLDDKGCNLIACFGGPNYQHDDDPSRGLGFALQLLNEITYVKMGIGVTTGDMFCGCVGNLGRREYAFVGDHINMAARLMLVKGVDILCDHSTYTFTIENFDFRQHDLVVVKGRDDQMEVYEPVCRKVEAEKAQWNVSFVGRLEEKRKVIDCMYNKSIVTVSAPEGYGKSRLLQYSTETARKLGFSAFSCTASKMHQQVTYFAIGQLIKQILRLNTDGYQSLVPRLKVLYVQQQIDHIVDKFHRSAIGNSRSIFNIETSTHFEKPRDEADRRGSLDSQVGAGSPNFHATPTPDSRSRGSSSGGSMKKIGEVMAGDGAEDEDSMRESDDTGADSDSNGRASTGHVGIASRRTSSFAAVDLSNKDDNSVISRNFSAGSLGSGTNSERASSGRGLGGGVQVNGTVLQSSLDRYRRNRISTTPTNSGRGSIAKVGIFGQYDQSGEKMSQFVLSQPCTHEFDDTASKASASDIVSVTSVMKQQYSLNKKAFSKLNIADFLYLMQSVVDIGITAPQTPNIAEMSSIARAQTLAKFFYYLVSSQRQSVFIVDEAQWLDSQSWMMLEKLTRRAKNICLIITGRKNNFQASSHMKSLSKSPRMVNINMSALDAAATASLASSLTQDAEWPAHIIDMVLKSTEGVPKQTVKLLETFMVMKHVEVVEKGVKENGKQATLRFADTKLISKTVTSFEEGAETAMMKKFDGLDLVAQTMLKVAAIFGSHFTCDMIIDLLPFSQRKDPAQVKSFYIMLCAQDWLRVDNVTDRQSITDAENVGATYANLLKSKGAAKTFSFSEDRTRKILYKMVPEVPTRQTMHNEAARCMAAFYFDDLQAVFPILAYHYKMGGAKEDEIKACQMAAMMSTRQGHLAEGIRFLTRCLEIVETKEMKFLKFEHFDKGTTLAEWCLSLAQCEYAFGRNEKTRKALLGSLKWLQISEKEKLTLNLAAGTKDLNKIFTNLAKHLFMNAPGKKVSVKSDKLNSVSVKTVGFLFLLSILDMNEESTIMYGVNLTNLLLDLKTEQGTYAAVLVCSLLRYNASGMVAKKAASYIFSKLETIETNSKWFKEASWAVIGVTLTVIYYGSDLEKAVKVAKGAFKKAQTLNTTIGHVESLQAVTACELAEGNTNTVNRNIALFGSLTKTLDNPTSKVWEAAALIRKFQVGSLLLEADEYKQVMGGLNTVRKVTKGKEPTTASSSGAGGGDMEVAAGKNFVDSLPKAIQLDAYATESSAVLILGMQEPEYWRVSFEGAKRGLEIMKGVTNVPLTFSKDSFVIITITFLNLYKELLTPESVETDDLKYKDEVMQCILECQKCLGLMPLTFPLAKPVISAIDEVVGVIKGSITPKKCDERLSAIKLGVGKFCKNDAMFIETLAEDIQGFAAL